MGHCRRRVGGMGRMKVAIVHEWLERYAGSERVFEQLIALFPDADIYSLVDFRVPNEMEFLAGKTVRTSFIQKLPLARRHFRKYLALMPVAVEQFSLTNYDLFISSNHAVAKGVITGPDQLHISYVHSPMRYAWDLQSQYLEEGGMGRGLRGLSARWLLHRLRLWDVRTANGVDIFVANSRYIARRIYKTYRRESVVVHPPVDVQRFALWNGPRTSYLVAGRFVPYKRIDLVVEAFRDMPDRRLVVIGSGPEEAKIRRLAAGADNITLLPPQPQGRLVEHMQQARAFVFAGEEDFGISLVEAQACGTPLIVFGRGGVTDIIVSRPGEMATGILFPEQNAGAIKAAVEQFELSGGHITPALCRANAMRFSVSRFHDEMLRVINDAASESGRRVMNKGLASISAAA